MALGSGNDYGGPNPFSSMFGAAGDLLGEQVQGETEEMKRRKALLKQMQDAVSPLGASNVLGLQSASTAMGGMRARRGG